MLASPPSICLAGSANKVLPARQSVIFITDWISETSQHRIVATFSRMLQQIRTHALACRATISGQDRFDCSLGGGCQKTKLRRLRHHNKPAASNGDECCLTAASLELFLDKTRGPHRPPPGSADSARIWRKFRVSVPLTKTFRSDTCIHPHLAHPCGEVHLPARNAYLDSVALPKNQSPSIGNILPGS